MAMFTIENNNGEVPFPSHVVTSVFTIAALDNFDHDERNLSGIGGAHDTVTALFKEMEPISPASQVFETGIQHGRR